MRWVSAAGGWSGNGDLDANCNAIDLGKIDGDAIDPIRILGLLV